MSFRYLSLTLKLNFNSMETSCCSAMNVHFIHWVVMARLDTSTRREFTSLSVNLFRELFQVIDRMVTKSERFLSVIHMVRYIVLMNVLR